ncbi:MAG: NAD(P)/FAD-dependent oxidoreductase [Mycoplasmataceae bacterium]|nr:NAD(P)/FAD-dependent oxidoreductase [Mycoplasmataceae bacterium]
MRKKEKKNKEVIQEKIYNVVIIGAGQTGMTLAKILMKYNSSVLLIDDKDPGIKSSLDVKLFSFLANKNKGVKTDKFLSILKPEMEKMRIESNSHFNKSIFENSSVHFIKGKPKIISDQIISVGEENFNYKKLVFANGSYYKKLDIPGIQDKMYIDPTQISDLDQGLETVAIYGTNWVSLELGQALTKIGIKVYFVDKNVNPFNDFDDEVEATLKKQFKNKLIGWCLESEVINHQFVSDNTIRITMITDSKQHSIEVNKIISTETRVPNTKSVECPFELFVNKNGAFIIDSSFKMKDQQNFYAIGDVNGLHMYPNQGYYHAFLLSQNLVGISSKLDVYNFSFSLNIQPSISFYGMNKNQIEHSQISYNEFIYEFRDDYKTKLNNQIGKIKIFTNNKHEILGAILIGDKLSELISLLIMAKQNKIKFHKLAWLNLPFFSKAEGIRDAALEYYYEFVLDEKKIKTKTKIKKITKKIKKD